MPEGADSRHGEVTDEAPDPSEPAERSEPSDEQGEQDREPPLSPEANAARLLDFCTDPGHRAHGGDFDALERELGSDGARGEPTPRFRFVQQRALGLLADHPHAGTISDRGALAAHSYSTHDVYRELNAAGRVGGLTETQLRQTRAILSGLNELPSQEGPMVRTLGFEGDALAAELAAAHYEVGQVTVETTLTSLSMKTADNDKPLFDGDVELHVQSRTARRLAELATEPSEREAVLAPASQLLVHSKELVSYPHKEGGSKQKWVIEAEEITPDDPRYLGRAEVQQRLVERFGRTRADADTVEANRTTIGEMLEGKPKHAGSGEGTTSDPTASETPRPPEGASPGTAEPASPRDEAGADQTAQGPSKIENALAGEPVYRGAHDGPDLRLDDPYGAPQLPVDADGNPDWRQLGGANPPAHELPAIHGGTAHPEHQAAYVDARHPELGEVNPNYDQPNAYREGFQTNCTRCVVSYAQRLMGHDVQAEPVRPEELASKGTLPWVQEQLGGQWERHGSYDDVIQRMSGQPIGSHAVVGVLFPNELGRPVGHVAMVTNTPEGVAFIDPQTGKLMTLPHPALQLDLLPFGSPGHDGATAGAARSDSGAERSEGDTAEPSANRTEPVSEAHSQRPGGPWFGQHTNPLRPALHEEEEDREPIFGRAVEPPAASAPAAHEPRPSNPGPPGEQPGTPTPPVGPPGPNTPVPPASTRTAPPAAAVPGSADLPAPAGGLNKSLSGTLDPAAPPPTSRVSGELGAPGNVEPPSGTSASGAGSGAAPTGGAVPDRVAGEPRSGASEGQSRSKHMSGQVADQSAMPFGAGAQPPAGNTNPAQREPWRAGAASSITHNQERTIPLELVPRYLGNQDPSPMLTRDGRQVMFRRNVVADLGSGHLDEARGELAVKVRFAAPEPAGAGDDGSGDVEFADSAELVAEDSAGSAELLGTYDGSTQSWTPTRAGLRWLEQPGASSSETERGRTP